MTMTAPNTQHGAEQGLDNKSVIYKESSQGRRLVTVKKVDGFIRAVMMVGEDSASAQVAETNKGVTQHSSTKGYGHDRNDFGGAANASPAVLNNWQPAVEAYRGDKVKIIAH